MLDKTMKPFIVPKMIFKVQSRSSTMSSFVRSLDLIRDWKKGCALIFREISPAEMTLEMAQFNRPHFRSNHVHIS